MHSAFTARLRSFRFAVAGVRTLFATQPNFRIHAGAAVATIASGVLLHVSLEEWRWLIAAIVGVWISEAFNTALEFLADAVSADHHPLIGKAKDCAAAAVLFTAIGAATIGIAVFAPRLLTL